MLLGAGYLPKRTVKQEYHTAAEQINSVINENPPPLGLTEEQVDDQIMGVIIAEHFSLKKDTALFGDKAEQATTDELQTIHDMGTYELLDASKLTRYEKREALKY